MTKRLAKKIVWKAGHGHPYRRFLLKRAVAVYRRELTSGHLKWLA